MVLAAARAEMVRRLVVAVPVSLSCCRWAPYVSGAVYVRTMSVPESEPDSEVDPVMRALALLLGGLDHSVETQAGGAEMAFKGETRAWWVLLLGHVCAGLAVRRSLDQVLDLAVAEECSGSNTFQNHGSPRGSSVTLRAALRPGGRYARC